MATTIKTNRQWRELQSWADLPSKAQKDFDYLKDDEMFSPRFVLYRGEWYDAIDTMRVSDAMELPGWHSYHGDSYFSGVLFKFSRDCERVICGTYYA